MGQGQPNPSQHPASVQAQVSRLLTMRCAIDNRWDIDVFGEPEEQDAPLKVW